MASKCPICGGQATAEPPTKPTFEMTCTTCGHFKVTLQAQSALEGTARAPKIQRWIHRANDDDKTPLLDMKMLDALEQASPPTAMEQADECLLLLARKSSDVLGMMATFSEAELMARLGMADARGISFVLQHLEGLGFLREARCGIGSFAAQLTVSGWNRVQEMRRSSKDSRLIFMAMQFDNVVLRELVDRHFKPAAVAAGFTMRRVDEEPRAGLIDDLIRVDIRNSAMVVSDLTDRNRGAYWEAGFAEGLEKPVLYTCEAGAFHDERHFDVEHAQTIKWATGKFEEAAKELKAAIRATLPHLAKMED